VTAQVSALGNGTRLFIDELNRKVNEDTVEKGNFAAFATFEMLKEVGSQVLSSESYENLNTSTEQSSSSSSGSSNGNSSTLVQKLSTLVSSLPNIFASQELRKIFFFYQEEPGLLTASWSPVIIVITTNGWIHLFKLPTGTKPNDIKQAYDAFVSSSKFSFEDDLLKPVDPSLSAKDPKCKYLNPNFGGACSSLTSDEIEANHAETLLK
jgi:hypothetical protein